MCASVNVICALLLHWFSWLLPLFEASTPPNTATILYENAVEITAEATPRYESINTANTSSAPAAASALPSIATILYEEAVENTAEATPRYESVNTADTSSAPAAESDDKVSDPHASNATSGTPALCA